MYPLSIKKNACHCYLSKTRCTLLLFFDGLTLSPFELVLIFHYPTFILYMYTTRVNAFLSIYHWCCESSILSLYCNSLLFARTQSTKRHTATITWLMVFRFCFFFFLLLLSFYGWCRRDNGLFLLDWVDCFYSIFLSFLCTFSFSLSPFNRFQLQFLNATYFSSCFCFGFSLSLSSAENDFLNMLNMSEFNSSLMQSK